MFVKICNSETCGLIIDTSYSNKVKKQIIIALNIYY